MKKQDGFRGKSVCSQQEKVSNSARIFALSWYSITFLYYTTFFLILFFRFLGKNRLEINDAKSVFK